MCTAAQAFIEGRMQPYGRKLYTVAWLKGANGAAALLWDGTMGSAVNLYRLYWNRSGSNVRTLLTV